MKPYVRVAAITLANGITHEISLYGDDRTGDRVVLSCRQPKQARFTYAMLTATEAAEIARTITMMVEQRHRDRAHAMEME